MLLTRGVMTSQKGYVGRYNGVHDTSEKAYGTIERAYNDLLKEVYDTLDEVYGTVEGSL